eukprot:m51a1_g6394 hypothetical protein (562) ;mRNA; f:207871-210098
MAEDTAHDPTQWGVRPAVDPSIVRHTSVGVGSQRHRPVELTDGAATYGAPPPVPAAPAPLPPAPPSPAPLPPEDDAQAACSLSLSFRNFQEGLPEDVWGPKPLSALALTNDHITEIPTLIARLTSLEKLNLCNNELTDLPESFSELRNLKSLVISFNKFESVPQAVTTLPSLTTLSLEGNAITELTPAIGNLRSLTELLAGCNRIETVPPELGNLTALERLSLARNMIQTLPRTLWSLRSLRELLLPANEIAMFPSCVHYMTSLVRIDLSHNRLVVFQEHSEGLANLKALAKADFSNNSLSTLPPEFGALAALKVLDLSNNQLMFMPPALAGLKAIKALDLSHNQITEIPRTFVGLEQLEHLDLSFNQLEDVPETVLSLSSLKHLGLIGNPLPALPGFIEKAGIARSFTEESSPPNEVLPRLWLGNYNNALNRAALKRRNVTHILSVAPVKPAFPKDFIYFVIPVEDEEDVDLTPYFQSCIEFIQGAMARGESTLVHCMAGVSRSATIVAAYVMVHNRMTAENAVAFVQEQRSMVCPNMAFRKQLLEFEKTALKGRPCCVQ